MEDFKTKNTAIIDKLIQDNPSMAAVYGHELVGGSYETTLMHNVFSAINIGSIAGPITAKVLQKAALASATRQAMRQAITAPAEQASKAGMAEAVGDVKEAAIQKATSR